MKEEEGNGYGNISGKGLPCTMHDVTEPTRFCPASPLNVQTSNVKPDRFCGASLL